MSTAHVVIVFAHEAHMVHLMKEVGITVLDFGIYNLKESAEGV